jgi:hypothetical protein
MCAWKVQTNWYASQSFLRANSNQKIAERILRHVSQIELGDGSKSRHDVGMENEWRNAAARSRQASSGSDTRPNRRTKCEVAEKAHHHRRAERELVSHLRQSGSAVGILLFVVGYQY